MKKNFIVHPFLFALFPVLFLFSQNRGDVAFKELLVPVVVVLLLALAAFFAFRLIFRDWHKAGLASSFFLLLFFSYGHMLPFVSSISFTVGRIGIGPNKVLMALFFGVFIIGALFLFKVRAGATITSALSIAALALVVFSAVNIGVYWYTSRDTFSGNDKLYNAGGNEKVLRDIYYLVLDGYANGNTLQYTHGFDNSDFLAFLEDRGFYVARKSTSNYSQTTLSLFSSLNMQYVDVSDPTLASTNNKGKLYQGIYNSAIWQFLKPYGYKFIYSTDKGEKANPYAHKNIYLKKQTALINEFTLLLLQTSALRPFVGEFASESARDSFLYKMEQLKEIPDMPEPTFTFMHVMPPHPPYIFDAQGGARTVREFAFEGDVWRDRQSYVEQLKFVNKKMREVVDAILAKSTVAPIIVIQSDHGSAALLEESGWETPTSEGLWERMSNLNVYYLPDSDWRVVYPSITPVNSFRVIFNTYFGADLELFPDRIYFSTYDEVYQFTDATDIVSRVREKKP